MPTQAYFDQYPSFPDDVQTAELQRVSFAKLLSQDSAEAKTLFEACRAWGFFVLDFEGCEEGQSFLQSAADMFELDKEVNSMDVEELMKYAYKPPYSLFGYKEAGNLKIEDGRPDRVEFYNVGRDDIMGVSAPLSNPPCIEQSRLALKSYMEQAHSIVRLICATLDSQLRLPSGTLASLQPLDKPSGTALRLLRYLPQPTADRRTSLLGHTDIGSLTILFNITGGLQLLAPGTDPTDEANWRYVKPVPGCAIVNLGDAMVEWSAGVLRSNMHRVTYAPGAQGQTPRYSHAYLVRPQAEAPMKRLAGGDSLIPELEQGEEENTMNAKEWEAHKAVAIRQGRDNARSRGGREIKLKGEKIATVTVSEVGA
ncbi:putative oxidoreductase [Hypoxylon rubiginosum]|uniref:Oxidoreductase n=1 Tax=Hypoxylon rubiginosum TaxID=110542 RepID=A0ACC0CT90_9PEZI|nr:putative oxidoreductase [Hypoxylon rubiginosum]